MRLTRNHVETVVIRPRERRTNIRQMTYLLNKMNMTGVIGLGSGRVKADVCTLSK